MTFTFEPEDLTDAVRIITEMGLPVGRQSPGDYPPEAVNADQVAHWIHRGDSVEWICESIWNVARAKWEPSQRKVASDLARQIPQRVTLVDGQRMPRSS